MIIENINTNNASDKSRYLAYAQTITNYFIEAIDQNDCNVKVVVGYYQELDDDITSVLDLDEAFKNLDPTADVKEDYKSKTYLDEKVVGKIDPSNFVTRAAAKDLKDQCYSCNLSMPKINIDADYDFLFNKLSFKLTTYKDVFQNPLDQNFCHLVSGLQYTCIPDIVKLIGMLLTAYAAILALNKLPSFSLNAFIKGVIGTLLAKVVGSLKISLDATQTGLPCVLSLLEELAYNVPTQQSLYDRGDARSPDYVPVSIYKNNLDVQLKNKDISEADYDKKLREYKEKNDPIINYKERLEAQVGSAEQNVSQVFEYVNEVVEKAQSDINSYVATILGTINHFECESKRSGPDFTEVMAYMAKLTKVINIFSALVAIILKKTVNVDLCKDERALKDLNKSLVDKLEAPLSNADLEDILTEYSGTKSKLSEDGLSILIYENPVETKLPKLNLMGCNFKEFTEAHTLENLINNTIEESLSNANTISKEEDFSDNIYEDRFNGTTGNGYYTDIIKPSGYSDYVKKVEESGYDVFNKNFKDSDLIYNYVNKIEDFDEMVTKISVSTEDVFGEGVDFYDVLDDLLDFIYNEPQNSDTNNSNNSNNTDIESLSIFNSTQEQRGSSKPSNQECRSIDDVMDVLKNINL